MSATAIITRQFDQARALTKLRALGLQLHRQATAHAATAELDDTLSQMRTVHDGLTIGLASGLSLRLGHSIRSVAARRAAAANIVTRFSEAA
ncbi:hypothetical protein E6W39_24080 [Kitasatospora acidiphila]|uniref:Uncharacterized protein n=1 Tax=Kitasatospora acidiphila TaxID=2567942 RepID=A0A540W6U0_9ACTN|nr:hypothetical protein [Kitasatospora acidiphila]TQF04736.1 hypothetical protein E6W39_24080 [Kitasatospora acidiphila]